MNRIKSNHLSTMAKPEVKEYSCGTKKFKFLPSPLSCLCTICFESTDVSFVSITCCHMFCANCISKYIDAKIQDNVANVKCPDPKCAALLDPQLCTSFISKQVFERWGDLLFEGMFLRFYCPFVDCGAAMVAEEEGETVTSSECPICRRMFCAQCRVGWHADMECKEFQKLRKKEGEGTERDDILTMKLAERKKWQRCPNCKNYVEKIEGCLHIRCRCSLEFCYGCGANWTSSHACPSPTR